MLNMVSWVFYVHINSRLFPMGVGGSYRTPPVKSLHTPLAWSTFIHLIIHTPVASTTHLTFLKNLANKINALCTRFSLLNH